MKRIDVHHHYLPPAYRAALEANNKTQPDGITWTPAWDEQAALEVMDKLNIGTAFLSISSPGVHFGDDAAARKLARQVNEDGAKLVKDHPGRFGLFASTPLPDIDGAIEEIRYAYDHLNADGIVFETNFHGVYLGDKKLEPVYAELNARHATIFIHPTSPHCPCCAPAQQDEAANTMALGYPRPMLEFMFETTRTVTNMVVSGVLERFPNIKIIVPHAGAALSVFASRIELVLPMLSPPGTHTPSMRAALKRMHFDVAGAPLPELLSALLQIADHDHIHYGSDWPFTPTPVCEKLTATLDATPLLDGRLRENVMGNNALKLFPRLAS